MPLTKVSNSMSSSAPASVLDYGADPSGVEDSSSAIQLALDSGAAEVYFPVGTYKINTTLTLPSSVRLFGKATIQSSITDNNMLDVNGKSNVVIDGLKFITAHDSLLSGSLRNAIYVYNSSKVWVKNCTFETTKYSRSVSLYVSNSCYVLNCYCTSPLLTPSVLNQPNVAAIYVGDTSSKISIANNIITNTGSGVAVQAIGSGNIYDVSITGNIISEQVGYGIYTYIIPPSEIRRVDIIGNVIDTVYGTYSNPAIGGNYTHGAGIYSVNVDDCVISSNIVRNTCIETNSESLTPGGIGVVEAVNTTITNNFVAISYKYGIFVDGVSLLVSGNNIANTDQAAIYSRISENLNITGNSIRFDPAYVFGSSQGIKLTDADGHDHLSPNIVGNMLSNCDSGIQLLNVYDATVSGNTLRNEGVLTNQGIATSVSGGNNIISNNRIELNGGKGVYSRQASNVVNGNIVTGASTNQAYEITGSNASLQLSGTGTPEGNVLAPIGSTFFRTDGGSGTVFYVKEAGTSNTGWVAK